MSLDAAALLRGFEAGTLDPTTFYHREHVAVAFALLGRHPFLDALTRYADGVRGLAERAGHPEKFNVTITVAFMSLIAERMAECPDATFDAFERRSADLLSRSALQSRYSRRRLRSNLARRQFLLPDHADGGGASR